MENEIISKKEIEELMKLKGETIGTLILQDLAFIKKEDGEEALRKFKEYIESLNLPIKFEEIKPKNFYPIWFDAIILLTMERLLNYDAEKFQRLGRSNFETNILTRFLMRYFVSLDKTGKEVPNMWKKYYTVGDLSNPEYSNEKRYSVLRLENFVPLPNHCEVLKGYFARVTEVIVGKPTTCEEVKCPLKGDSWHEFILHW